MGPVGAPPTDAPTPAVPAGTLMVLEPPVAPEPVSTGPPPPELPEPPEPLTLEPRPFTPVSVSLLQAVDRAALPMADIRSTDRRSKPVG